MAEPSCRREATSVPARFVDVRPLSRRNVGPTMRGRRARSAGAPTGGKRPSRGCVLTTRRDLHNTQPALHHRERYKRMKRMIASAVLGLALSIAATTVSAQDKLDRTVLPIAEPKRPTYSELDARKAKLPARFEVTAPKGAPHVVIVLIDDIGFGGPAHSAVPSARQHWTSLPSPVCGSTTSTRRRCARRHETRSRPAGTTTPPIPVRSWRRRRPSPATSGRSRTALRPWRKCYG